MEASLSPKARVSRPPSLTVNKKIRTRGNAALLFDLTVKFILSYCRNRFVITRTPTPTPTRIATVCTATVWIRNPFTPPGPTPTRASQHFVAIK